MIEQQEQKRAQEWA
jgi:hypothetical protein